MRAGGRVISARPSSVSPFFAVPAYKSLPAFSARAALVSREHSVRRLVLLRTSSSSAPYSPLVPRPSSLFPSLRSIPSATQRSARFTFATSLSRLQASKSPHHLTMLRRPFSNQADAPNKGSLKQFWERWTAERPQHPRFSLMWWWDMLIIFTVFGITGSSTMFFVRPFITKFLKLEGSMKEGPWSYRLSSVALIMPMYSIILMCIATIFGRQAYFKKVVLRMWSRFLPKRWIKAIEGKTN